MQKINIAGLEALPGAADSFLKALGENRVVAFFGEMGAGKTTFIKSLCDRLRVSDVTSSPSFGLVNEYNAPGGETIYHLDFYRLRDIEEAFDLGYEEYLYSGHYCFIEWPEKIESLLPGNTVKVLISVDEKGGRVIEPR